MATHPHKLLRIMASFAGLLMILILAGGCTHTGLMKTPNLYVSRGDDPFAALPESRKSVEVDLIYATDRQAMMESEKPQGTGNQYGHLRSDHLFFGRTTVNLAEGGSWEDLHQVSLTRHREHRFTPRLVHTAQRGRFPAASKTWRLENGEVVRGPSEAEAAAELAALVEAELADASGREAYVFIHGYNNQFYHAALTMAQLWHFMSRPGVPIIYSWPAGRGGLRGYTADTESSHFTIFHLKQFLRALAATPGLEKIHILAHSRGTDVATTALKELMLDYRGTGLDPRDELKLGNLVLAAPDLDVEVANQSIVAEGMIFVPERFTIYLSKGDRALKLSSWLTDSVKRLGSVIIDDMTPRERANLASLPNVTFIEANVESDITGHAYLWINPAASSDVILLLRDNLDPGAEHGRPLTRRLDNFWQLDESYLKHPEP